MAVRVLAVVKTSDAELGRSKCAMLRSTDREQFDRSIADGPRPTQDAALWWQEAANSGALKATCHPDGEWGMATNEA